MSFLYRFLHSFTSFLFSFLYKIEVYGLENLTPGAAIIAPNHTSYLDPPIIGVACPERLCYIARKSLFKNHWINKILTSFDAYPIAGNDGDRKTIRMVSEMLGNQKKVVIFPEGERSWSGKLQRAKQGVSLIALKNDCPIIPVYIYGAHKVWKRAKRFPSLTGKIICIFGKPIFCEDYSQMDKKLAMELMTEELENRLESLQSQLQNKK